MGELQYLNSLEYPEKVRERPMLAQVDKVLFDFDGVMTDNRVLVGEVSDTALVFVNRSDGLGVQLLTEAGLYVGIITGERGGPAYKRASKLHIPCFDAFQWGGKDQTIIKNGLMGENTLYVGNDVNDLEVRPYVGFFVVTGDCHKSLWKVADLQLSKCGGYGAVREICDMILEDKCK